jgi:hypothetical protein
MTARVTLGGTRRTLLPNSRPAGPIDPREVASLTVRTRSRGDLSVLEQRARAQASLPLSQRTYLTHSELEDAYGSRAEDLDLVEQLAHEHDISVMAAVLRRGPSYCTAGTGWDACAGLGTPIGTAILGRL